MDGNIRLVGNRGYYIKQGEVIERTLNYNYEKMLEGIRKWTYQGMGMIRDENVEKMSGFPQVGGFFYKKVMEKGLPTAHSFYETVVKEHFDISPDGTEATLRKNGKKCSVEGLRGRMYRMYPSLLRDFMFFVLCSTSGAFDEVEYSLELDWIYGYDLYITHQGERFGVALFTDTKRAHDFKNHKYGRRRDVVENTTEIVLTINPFSKDKQVGDYALYNMDDVYLLKNAIIKHLSETKKVS